MMDSEYMLQRVRRSLRPAAWPTWAACCTWSPASAPPKKLRPPRRPRSRSASVHARACPSSCTSDDACGYAMHVELVRTVTRDGLRLDGALLAAPTLDLPTPGSRPTAAILLHGVAGNFYTSSTFEPLIPQAASARPGRAQRQHPRPRLGLRRQPGQRPPPLRRGLRNRR